MTVPGTLLRPDSGHSDHFDTGPALLDSALEGASLSAVDSGYFNAVQPPLSPSCAALILVQWRPQASSLLWGWSRLVRGPRALASTAGLRSAHVLGSGHHGGFGLRPSSDRQGLICFFDTTSQAAAFLHSSSVAKAYRDHAVECMGVLLRTTACRGAWGGVSLVGTGPAPAWKPVASLTRASIRLTRAHQFWRHAPATQQAVAVAPGCRLAVGLGEAPLLRQATFSVWDNDAALENYARSGAHRDAAQGAWQKSWFSESMFARFEVLAASGLWRGRSLDLEA
jgi:hypothetical protein